jgi:molecular chaperone GrpE
MKAKSTEQLDNIAEDTENVDASETEVTDANGAGASDTPTPWQGLSREQVEDLKAKAAKADEHWDRLVRQTADFENYKKRMAREKLEATRFANESLLEKLIPILDNFDMATAAATTSQGDSIEALRTGVNMIHTQLKSVLSQAGLEEIDASGQTFDPNWHEAISQQDSTELPEGKVMHQVRKGYKYRDRLLRPAAVVVSKKPTG